MIVLSGKKENFADYCEEKFLSRASRRGFQELLIGYKLEEVPMDSTILEATQADEKKKIRTKYLNKEAFEEFILSIDTSTAAGRVAFRIIKGCKTKYQRGTRRHHNSVRVFDKNFKHYNST